MLDSLSFLEIWEATVITFLVPTLTAFVTWIAANVRLPLTSNCCPFTLKTFVLNLHRRASLSEKHQQD